MLQTVNFANTPKSTILAEYADVEIAGVAQEQKAIPALAKNGRLIEKIEQILPTLPTCHQFHRTDSTRIADSIDEELPRRYIATVLDSEKIQ